MHVQHHLYRLLLVEVEEATQHFNHEIHRGEVVVEQQYPKQGWSRHLRLGRFHRQSPAVIMFVFGFVGHEFLSVVFDTEYTLRYLAPRGENCMR